MACIEFMDKDTGFAVGPKMYRTTNAGKTWSIQNSSQSNFSQIHFADAQTGYACGSNNLVLKTSNGGLTWQSIPTAHSDDDFYTICSVNADTVFFIAMDDLQTYKYAKYIHYTYDGGSTWQRQSTGSTQTMRCMHMWNSKEGIIGQLTAGIIRTTNGWTNYSTINAGLQITGMDVIKDSVVVLVGNNGKIARSSDYGKSFKAINSPTTEHLTNVNFANDSFGMACGYNGTILLTTDGGRNWIKMNSTTTNQVNDVEVINPFYAWFIVHSSTDSFDTYKFGSEKFAASNINIIRGAVSGDLNGNCIWDSDERGAEGILVRADPGGFMTYTRRNGDFELVVSDTGTFSLSTRLPQKYLVGDGLCDSVIGNIRFTALDQRSFNNRFMFESDTSVRLQVTVISPRKRRCGTNAIQIRYKNLGFRPVDSVDLKLTYPSDLIGIKKSSHSYTSANNSLNFTLGKLAFGEEGVIDLVDTVYCKESSRNNTVCLKVLITPRVQVLNESWDSSWIRSKLDCYDTLVILKVYNDGETMKDSGDLDLFVGDIYQDRQRYLLHRGDSMRWQIERGDEEVIVYGDVRRHHPYEEEFRVWKERCRMDSVLKVNKVSAYRMVRLRSFEDELCVPIRDSYDPNDIRVFPSGTTEQHWIPNMERLKYIVRFQNTGNDTAYVVRVVDTLPSTLDPFSLEMIGSSHEMSTSLHEFKGKTVLTCLFENINLVDSATNPPLSEGWFSFRIDPQSNFKHRTRISNLVDIYFDFNPPIRTNTAWVQIYDSALNPLKQVRPIDCATTFKSGFSDTLICDRRQMLWDIPVKGLNEPTMYALSSGIDILRLGREQFRISAPAAGNYHVVRSVMDCDRELRDTAILTIKDAPVPFLRDSTVCFQADYWLRSKCSDCNFLWHDGSDSSAFNVQMPGVYKVQIENACGQILDSNRVSVLAKRTLNIGRDTIVCDRSELELVSNLGPQTLWWSGRYTERITVVGDGKYQARYTDQCNSLRDTIWVRFRRTPRIDMGKDTLYCERVEHHVKLALIDFEHQIQWNDQNTSFNRILKEPGQYWVRSENLCGVYSDSLQLYLDYKPQLTLGADTGFCGPFSHILKQVEVKSGEFFQWTDTKRSGDRIVDRAGAYSATIQNLCGTASDTISIAQHPVPKAEWSLSNPCDTGLLYFLNHSTISNGTPLQFQWDLNGEFSSSQREPSVDFELNGPKRIRLMVRSRENCRDSLSKDLAVGWFARSNFAWQDPVCAGDPVSFRNTSFTTAPSVRYQWSMDDGSTYTDAEPTHDFGTISANKSYQIKLISIPVQGCSDTFTRNLIVHPLPQAELTDSVYRNKLFLNLRDLSPGTAISWLLGSEILGIDSSLMFAIEVGGKGRICAELKNTAGCADTICTEFENTWHNDEELRVFPNPANSYVECWFKDKTKRTIRIYSVDGRKLIEVDTEEDHLLIDLRHLVIGTYVLESDNGSNQLNRLKLVIH